MAKGMKSPHIVLLGYNLYQKEGLAVIERSLLLDRAAKYGDVSLQSTWLALSDAIAFTADFLPPDLVLVVVRPVESMDCAYREEVADGR